MLVKSHNLPHTKWALNSLGHLSGLAQSGFEPINNAAGQTLVSVVNGLSAQYLIMPNGVQRTPYTGGVREQASVYLYNEVDGSWSYASVAFFSGCVIWFPGGLHSAARVGFVISDTSSSNSSSQRR